MTDSSNQSRSFDIKYQQWLLYNSLVIGTGILGFIIFNKILLLILLAVISFLFLIILCRHRWTPTRVFGLANGITGLRLGGCLIFGTMHTVGKDWMLGGVCFFLLVLDGLDGLVARKLGQTSEFGKYFDQEVDALFLLILVCVIYQKEYLGSWVLSMGLLRYFYVLLQYLAKPKHKAELRSNKGRYIYFFSVIALIGCFSGFPEFYQPVSIIALLLLLYSFTADIRQIYGGEIEPIWKRFSAQRVESTEDIKLFFDKIADTYNEQHGPALRLLKYRLCLLRNSVYLQEEDRLLDIGCGNGHHLLALSDEIKHGIGIDISPKMIEHAQKSLSNSSNQDKFRFLVNNAETLSFIPDQSVDIVTCFGAFEHMINKIKVLESSYRVLAPGGRIIFLTPNGRYFWYNRLAPLLKLNTHHLSTDRFLKAEEIRSMFEKTGFQSIKIKPWSFIPFGDIPGMMQLPLKLLDWIGKKTKLTILRGGLIVFAKKSPKANEDIRVFHNQS